VSYWEEAAAEARRAGGSFAHGPFLLRNDREAYKWEAVIDGKRYGGAIDVVTEKNKESLSLQALHTVEIVTGARIVATLLRKDGKP
jgi:hypothetical protein